MDFRKVAIATWTRSIDPATYGELDLPIASNFKGSPLALCVYQAARSVAEHPEINGIIRWRKLQPRKTIDITIIVHVEAGNLQFLTLKNCDKKSLEQIQDEIKSRSVSVKKSQVSDMKGVEFWIRRTPRLLLPALLWFYDFLVMDLELNLKWLGLPPNPFGAVVISNIGTFGLRRGFVPLVPLTRANVFITIGQISERLVLKDGAVSSENYIPLGITFDHRAVDGYHIGKLAKAMLKSAVAT